MTSAMVTRSQTGGNSKPAPNYRFGKLSLMVVLPVGPRLAEVTGSDMGAIPSATAAPLTDKRSLTVKLPMGDRMRDIDTAMILTSMAEIEAARTLTTMAATSEQAMSEAEGTETTE